MKSSMKFRIVHIITKLELGGAQRNTLYTVSHLPKDRYEPFLITGRGGILDEEARQYDLPVYFASTLVRPIYPWQDVLALLDLYHRLREIKPHIVHTHSSKAGILGRLAAYLAGVPVIIHTYHGFGITPQQNRIVRRCLIWVERLCARVSTHTVYVSEDNRQFAARLKIGLRKPSSVIRSGILLTPPLTSSTLRKEFGIPSDAWVVSSVGNFKPQKNPADLIKTAEAVLEKDSTIHFLLVGDGELRPVLEKSVQEKGLAGQIHFLGWRKDVPEILAASNAFLLTSLWEGLPRSLVEALAAQRPAVAYSVDGVKELLEEGRFGFPITPGDTATAAEKLLWLKAHPEEAHAMGTAGRSRVEKEFDINLMVRQQEALYEALYGVVPLKEYYEPLWT